MKKAKDPNHIQHFVVFDELHQYGSHDTVKLAQFPTFHISFIQTATFDHNFIIKKMIRTSKNKGKLTVNFHILCTIIYIQVEI